MKKYILYSLLLFFVACQVAPSTVEYGMDKCDYCDMTIVDNRFAAQMVTNKGKAYKFDSIECLVHSKQQIFSDVNMAYMLICDYNNPGKFTEAEKATYLVSENIKSPMSEHLAGFKNQQDALKVEQDNPGDIYDWTGINERLKK